MSRAHANLFEESDATRPIHPFLNMIIEDVKVKDITLWINVCAIKGVNNLSNPQEKDEKPVPIPFGVDKVHSQCGGKCVVYKCNSESCQW